MWRVGSCVGVIGLTVGRAQMAWQTLVSRGLTPEGIACLAIVRDGGPASAVVLNL